MKKLLERVKKMEPEKGTLGHTLYDAVFTFLFTPDEVTHDGVHIRDSIDLKRTMIHVVLALIPCYLFGMYNVGHQHFVALGQHVDVLSGVHLKFFFGLFKVLPLLITAYVVGLAIEIYYAYKRNHAVEEGYFVTGALIPLIMPPDLPIWMLVFAVVFAVIIGKEAFGGTGMNIWNVALLARVFVFFAYPGAISGDQVWVAGIESASGGAAAEYNWWYTGFLNTIFEWFGASTFDTAATVVDGFTGATPLGLAFTGGQEAIYEVYNSQDIFWGLIPGSIGETSVLMVLVGAAFLLITGIASARIMVSMFVGAVVMALIFNAWGYNSYMEIPWDRQLAMGSFYFAMAFMATDPVTASQTKTGKVIYGFLIGALGLIIRVINPAYPEGWMLAILLLNTFAPTIDHYVVQSNINKRLKRA